jgi:hypothetical protein
MSKIFSEIKKMPGNSGVSSASAGMTQYASNKPFAKGNIRKARIARVPNVGDVVEETTTVTRRIVGGKKSERSENLNNRKTKLKEQEPTPTPTPAEPEVMSVSSPVPPGAPPFEPVKPVDPIAAAYVPEPVSPLWQYLGSKAGKVWRRKEDRQAREYERLVEREQALIEQNEKKIKTLKDQIDQSGKAKDNYAARKSTEIEAGNVKAQDATNFVIRNRKNLRNAAIALGVASLKPWQLFDVEDEKPKSSNDWYNQAVEAGKKYLSNSKSESKDKTSSSSTNAFGNEIPRKMNSAFYDDFMQRKQSRKEQEIKDFLSRRKQKSNTSNSKQLPTFIRGVSTQKRMIKKSSNTKNNVVDDIIDVMNQYITPNTNLIHGTSRKTKEYAPGVMSSAKKYGQIAARENRKTYGEILDYGKQLVDLVSQESKKGIGNRSKKISISIPATEYTPAFSQTTNVPSMKDLATRAKTVGERKRTGRYDESNAIERALQFVRDWGESIVPTPKPKLTGGLKDTYMYRTAPNKKGEWVSIYADMPKGPRKQMREDQVAQGIPIASRKNDMQIWETGTMKPTSTWKPQKQVKDKMVYDPQLKRYVSTRQKDSNDITDFEQYSDAKSIKKGKNMTKGKSMPKPSRRDLYGHASMGGRAMMKSMMKAFGQMQTPPPIGGGGIRKPQPGTPRPIRKPQPGTPPIGIMPLPNIPRPIRKPQPVTPPISGGVHQAPGEINLGSNGFFKPIGKSMRKSVSRMRSAGIEHLLGGYRGGKKMAKSSMSKRTRRITKNNQMPTPTPGLSTAGQYAMPTANLIIGPNGAMQAAQAGAMRGQPQNPLYPSMNFQEPRRTMSPKQIQRMETFATQAPPQPTSSSQTPQPSPQPLHFETPAQSKLLSMLQSYNQYNPKPRVDYNDSRYNNMQQATRQPTQPAKPSTYSFPKQNRSANGSMQGAMQGQKSYKSGTGGTSGMMKSVSSMRSAGTRHLVGGYRGGRAMMKSQDASGWGKILAGTNPRANQQAWIKANKPSMGGRAMMKSMMKAFGGQMQTPPPIGGGGIRKPQPDTPPIGIMPLPNIPRPIRKPRPNTPPIGIMPLPNIPRPIRKPQPGKPPMIGKSMMKSVSSMRSAGTRHLVGGYRGGSKLFKSATPTLATRNFRAKYQ